MENSGRYAVALRGEDEAEKHEMGHQDPPVRAEPVKQAIPVKIRTECLDQMSHIGAVEALALHDECLRPEALLSGYQLHGNAEHLAVECVFKPAVIHLGQGVARAVD